MRFGCGARDSQKFTLDSRKFTGKLLTEAHVTVLGSRKFTGVAPEFLAMVRDGRGVSPSRYRMCGASFGPWSGRLSLA